MTPPLWKASVTLPKDKAADVAAVFELNPPAPQSVLVAENPFENDATVEALYFAAAGESGKKRTEIKISASTMRLMAAIVLFRLSAPNCIQTLAF